MHYLLIDFGASRIKSVVYDTDLCRFYDLQSVESPFVNVYKITKDRLMKILVSVVKNHKQIDKIYICSILGGSYISDEYHSWKSIDAKEKNYCLISGLFVNQPTFHVHSHHYDFTNSETYSEEIRILGHINNIPVYSSLGDTNCVIESLDLDDTNIAINIGTGSQIIHKQKEKLIIQRFFPAGRSLLVYRNLFSSIGFDFFKFLTTLTLKDVIDSTLAIDLNVFKQSNKYTVGGSILKINEENFTINNLVGSIVKELVLQYKPYIDNTQRNEILLCGGIVKHIPCLTECFKHYYSNYTIINTEQTIDSTFIGMVKLIK